MVSFATALFFVSARICFLPNIFTFAVRFKQAKIRSLSLEIVPFILMQSSGIPTGNSPNFFGALGSHGKISDQTWGKFSHSIRIFLNFQQRANGEFEF